MEIFTVLVLIVLGLLPSLAWIIFYAHEDIRHPEPKKYIALAFIVGGLVTIVAYYAQLVLNGLSDALGIVDFSFLSFLILGGIEELFKFLGVFFCIHRLKAFDEPLHAMIYMIIAALGFAAVENVASLFQAAQGTVWNIAIVESLTLRFVGATLLHSLASGIVGYYWGLAFIRNSRGFALDHERELHPIFIGLLFATVLHAIFNYLIIETGPASYAIIFLIFVAFFVLSDFEKLKKTDI